MPVQQLCLWFINHKHVFILLSFIFRFRESEISIMPDIKKPPIQL